MNCQDPPSKEHDIHFGEELRASPPKRVKSISIHQGEVRVARPLFEVSGLVDMKMAGAGGLSQEYQADSREMHAQVKNPCAKETMQKVVNSVHELRVSCNSTGKSRNSQYLGGQRKSILQH
jgi:hypothetical protein